MRGDDNSFDLAVIATKAQHVPEALKVADELVGDGEGPVAGILLIQNGIATTKEGSFIVLVKSCHIAVFKKGRGFNCMYSDYQKL